MTDCFEWCWTVELFSFDTDHIWDTWPQASPMENKSEKHGYELDLNPQPKGL